MSLSKVVAEERFVNGEKRTDTSVVNERGVTVARFYELESGVDSGELADLFIRAMKKPIIVTLKDPGLTEEEIEELEKKWRSDGPMFVDLK